jgi:hypothetical protein
VAAGGPRDALEFFNPQQARTADAIVGASSRVTTTIRERAKPVRCSTSSTF